MDGFHFGYRWDRRALLTAPHDRLNAAKRIAVERYSGNQL
jgi:hypothetical protein